MSSIRAQRGTVLCLSCDLGALSWGTRGLSSDLLGLSASYFASVSSLFSHLS